jgi:hypothetical protein
MTEAILVPVCGLPLVAALLVAVAWYQDWVRR